MVYIENTKDVQEVRFPKVVDVGEEIGRCKLVLFSTMRGGEIEVEVLPPFDVDKNFYKLNIKLEGVGVEGEYYYMLNAGKAIISNGVAFVRDNKKGMRYKEVAGKVKVKQYGNGT